MLHALKYHIEFSFATSATNIHGIMIECMQKHEWTTEKKQVLFIPAVCCLKRKTLGGSLSLSFNTCVLTVIIAFICYFMYVNLISVVLWISICQY